MNNQDNIQQEYIEWEDHFQTTKEKVHLTYNELKIPGLRLFGMFSSDRFCTTEAAHPLLCL